MLCIVCLTASAGIAVQGIRSYDACTEDSINFSQEIADYIEAVPASTPECNVIVHTNGALPDFRLLRPDYTIKGPDNTYVACFSSEEEAAEKLPDVLALPGVEDAQCDCTVIAQEEAEPGSTWGIESMHLDALKDLIECDDTPVEIAVIDSGIEITHPAFSGASIDGHSFIDDNYDIDKYGHGTSIAGIILDIMKDLPVHITVLKILDDSGNGSALVAANAIRYAVEHGVEIINLSFVVPGRCSKDLDKAVMDAVNKDVIPVISAGNYQADLDRKTYCPAHLTEPLVVSGYSDSGNFYAASNYGSTVDICAPGTNICAPFVGGTYTNRNGTSFSVPHICAILGMFKLMMPDASADYLTAMLFQNTRDPGEPGYDVKFGWGIPDFSEGLRKPEDICIRNVTVKKEPNKTSYYYKEDFDPAGIELDVLYSNGSHQTITDGIFFTPDKLTRGTHTIYAHYETYTFTFNIEVKFHWWQWIIWIPLFGFIWY